MPNHMMPKVFSLHMPSQLAVQISNRLNVELSEFENRTFEDGEFKVRPLIDVQGRNCYILSSLYKEPGKSINDKVVELLVFVSTLKQNGARSVTTVAPYLCYARKDRQTKPFDPVTTRYFAQWLETAGMDAIVVMDVHNLAAFQNAFRCPSVHLGANSLFVKHIASTYSKQPLTVVSPDVGGVKRAEQFRQMLEMRLKVAVPVALMEKQRSSGVVSGELMAGDVKGRLALVIDDIISTGTTMAKAVERLYSHGASGAVLLASHCLFTEASQKQLSNESITEIVTTDSVVPLFSLAPQMQKRLRVLSIAELIAKEIGRLSDFNPEEISKRNMPLAGGDIWG